MHMLLLVGVSVGFVLSVLTFNNFYAERTFTASMNYLKNQVELKIELKKQNEQLKQTTQ